MERSLFLVILLQHVIRKTSDIDLMANAHEMRWDCKTPNDGAAYQQEKNTCGKGPNVTLVSLPAQVTQYQNAYEKTREGPSDVGSVPNWLLTGFCR